MTCCCSEQRASTYTSVADASYLCTRKVNATIPVTVYICNGLRPPLKNASFDTPRRRGVPNGTVRTKKRNETSTLSLQVKRPFFKLIRESHQRLLTTNQQLWSVQNSAWPLNHNPGVMSVTYALGNAVTWCNLSAAKILHKICPTPEQADIPWA